MLRRLLLPGLAVLAALVPLVPSLVLADPPAADPGRYYAATGQFLASRFEGYFDGNGGVAVFGYPITQPLQDNGATVQYFERFRLEARPPDGGVALGQLGCDLTAGNAFPRPEPFDSTDTTRYFPETGHSVSNGFLSYWLTHGGQSLLGFPISEELTQASASDGVARVVQYFERARLEYHEELRGTPYEVSLGLLGREYAQARGIDTTPIPAPAPAAPPAMSDLTAELLRLINADRAAAGVAPLRFDGQIAGVAQRRVEEMIATNSFSHTGPDGSSVKQRLLRAGIQLGWAGENYWGTSDRDRLRGARSIHAQMMAEPWQPQLYNHHWNIMYSGYSRIGIGVAFAPNGMMWAVENFADGG